MRWLLFALLATAVSAQEFEVASIRRCAEQSFLPGEVTGGRFIANCVSIDSLIEMAYVASHPPLARVTLQGAQAWTKSEFYQIAAKAEDPTTSERTLRGAMLWRLLETRFQLKTHALTDEIPVYEVQLGKDDGRLRAHEEHSCSPCAGGFRPSWSGNRTTLMAKGTSLDMLSLLGPMALDRPVLNRTGLTGSYTFRLEFEPERRLEVVREGLPGPPIFDALENELGLKLVEAKGPAARIVIDNIERPSDN